MDSNFRVPVTKIVGFEPIPGADKLEIAKVFDFNVVVRKGQYKLNDTVIYAPIDSILPNELEAKIFGPDSKVKLTKGRIRQIRLRGAVSQGMLIDPTDTNLTNLTEGDDVAEKLGIIKYEPPAPSFQSNLPGVKKERNKFYENPYFHQYGGLVNIKYYPEMFKDGDEVVYQEKIHGSNFRCGYLPQSPKNLWQKFLKLIGKFDDFQFCFGSNTVQRQHSSKRNTNTYYGKDIYWKMVLKYNLQELVQQGMTLYGEIYGPGVQKNYDYGAKELSLVVFDIKVLADDKKSSQWLTVDQVKEWCKQRGLAIVPELYRGPHTKELMQQYTKGPSLLGFQPIREGIVIRDPKETTSYAGKKFFKLLSEDYLDDKNNTDFH
jgi:RNA ligase (TIGR02306 family)